MFQCMASHATLQEGVVEEKLEHEDCRSDSDQVSSKQVPRTD